VSDRPTEDDPPAQVIEEPAATYYIGQPWTLAGQNGPDSNATFLQRDDRKGVGSFATVGCSCGQPFRVDLLNSDVKICPRCRTRYAHFLVLAATDDPHIIDDVMSQLADSAEPGTDDEQTDEQQLDDEQLDDEQLDDEQTDEQPADGE
jgi:hypothetical protein